VFVVRVRGSIYLYSISRRLLFYFLLSGEGLHCGMEGSGSTKALDMDSLFAFVFSAEFEGMEVLWRGMTRGLHVINHPIIDGMFLHQGIRIRDVTEGSC